MEGRYLEEVTNSNDHFRRHFFPNYGFCRGVHYSECYIQSNYDHLTSYNIRIAGSVPVEERLNPYPMQSTITLL